jgi:hypothetical protein
MHQNSLRLNSQKLCVPLRKTLRPSALKKDMIGQPTDSTSLDFLPSPYPLA